MQSTTRGLEGRIYKKRDYRSSCKYQLISLWDKSNKMTWMLKMGCSLYKRTSN